MEVVLCRRPCGDALVEAALWRWSCGVGPVEVSLWPELALWRCPCGLSGPVEVSLWPEWSCGGVPVEVGCISVSTCTTMTLHRSTYFAFTKVENKIPE